MIVQSPAKLKHTNQNPSKYYDFLKETITLKTDEQKYSNILVSSESRIWMISQKFIEVWDLDTKQRICKKDRPLKTFHLRTTFINKNTIVTIAEISQMSQNCELIAYNIDTQEVVIIGSFPMIADSQFYAYQDFQFIFYFQATKVLTIGSLQEDLMRFYYVDLNLGGNQQFKVKQFFNQNTYQNLQYDEIGTICRFSTLQNIDNIQYQFQLIQQNSCQIHKFQFQKNQCIADINKRFDYEAIIVMKSNKNNKILFYNTQSKFIIRQISLIFNVNKLMKFKGIWLSISNDANGYILQQCSLDFVYSFFQINCLGKRILNKFLPILYQHQNNNTTQTILSKVKISQKHQIKLILLMETSGIVDIFGDEILKQVINFTQLQNP